RQNAEHVAVKVGLRAGLDTGNGQAESDHASVVERAKGLTTDLAGDDEQAHRQEFDLGKAPDAPLQGHRLGELGMGGEKTRVDVPAGFPSLCFASCHRASISSSVDSSGVVPRS